MREPIIPIATDDPRLVEPRCRGLLPIQTVHENPWFTVRNRGGYYTTEYSQSQVIVLPLVDGRAVVMVRAKRPVIADCTLELPAGGIGEDETPGQGAMRELFEETGIYADSARFTPLIPIANSPNRNPQLIHIYQINLSLNEYRERGMHDDEVDAVVMYSFKKVSAMMIKGEIFIGMPMAILGRFLLERAYGLNPDHPECVGLNRFGAKGENH